MRAPITETATRSNDGSGRVSGQLQYDKNVRIRSPTTGHSAISTTATQPYKRSRNRTIASVFAVMPTDEIRTTT
jgi:hypothetical protein